MVYTVVHGTCAVQCTLLVTPHTKLVSIWHPTMYLRRSIYLSPQVRRDNGLDTLTSVRGTVVVASVWHRTAAKAAASAADSSSSVRPHMTHDTFDLAPHYPLCIYIYHHMSSDNGVGYVDLGERVVFVGYTGRTAVPAAAAAAEASKKWQQRTCWLDRTIYAAAVEPNLHHHHHTCAVMMGGIHRLH